MPNQGAVKFAFHCANNSPKLGDPGGKPNPKKSKLVRVVIDPFKIKGRKVNVATIAFGSMCLFIIVRLPSPNARAA